MEALVLTTQLKITSSYMNKSYKEGEGMAVFSKLDKDRQSEIAMTIKGYVDDLLSKVNDMKKEALEKAKKSMTLSEKKKMEKARQKIREVDAQLDSVLAK